MITLINVFTVKADKQEKAFQKIYQVYEEVVQTEPGFLDATLLKSDDGKKVTVWANWESAEHLAALKQNPRFKKLHNDEFFAAIAKVEPHLYSTAVRVVAS